MDFRFVQKSMTCYIEVMFFNVARCVYFFDANHPCWFAGSGKNIQRVRFRSSVPRCRWSCWTAVCRFVQLYILYILDTLVHCYYKVCWSFMRVAVQPELRRSRRFSNWVAYFAAKCLDKRHLVCQRFCSLDSQRVFCNRLLKVLTQWNFVGDVIR